jgi:hypothetical protein
VSSYQNVDVYVLTQDSKQPICGVLVRALSQDGTTIYTESETDSNGHVGFLLYTQTYTLRFYKFQVRFQQPQVINVVEGPGATPALNAFNVYGSVLVPPMASDARLCRASGYFRDITGAPHRYLNIIFIGDFAPVLLDGSGVLSERRAIKTDKDGFACVDLIRCANYSATVECYEDHIRKIRVPDESSVNLPDLLFPTVGSISFDPPSPWTLSVGEEISLVPTSFTTSQIPVIGSNSVNIQWRVADPSIVNLTLQRHCLKLRGLKTGSTTLLASRLDKTIISIPFEPFISGSGQPILVQ